MRLVQRKGALSRCLALLWPAVAATSLQAASAAAGSGGVGVISGDLRVQAAANLPTVTVTGQGFKITTVGGKVLSVPSGDKHRDRFLSLWWALHNPTNGYFSPLDIPFHAVETLVVEAPDYGHETTSETFSYWAWLEAAYSRYSGDYSTLRYAFDRVDAYGVPPMQDSVGAYRPQSTATYAPEEDWPASYPVALNQSVSTGQDPIGAELRAAYGDKVYGMHWLLDTSNWYGFGQGVEPTPINTFERGPHESVWRAVAHPSIEDKRYGEHNNGFLSLFTSDPNGLKRQWRYTAAPDADARMVQAVYLAKAGAVARGEAHAIDDLVAKATKMGDFLRYGMFDKYFKKIGCQTPYCAPGQGYDGAHYLLGWYYSWGGSYPDDPNRWSWRVGSSHAHFGYQNPLAAYVLGHEEAFRAPATNAARDWQVSLQRQLQFYQWLQSHEGAIAGGATSSWNGRYDAYPAGTPTFHDMAYVESPVYLDPASNSWFGWQAWSMDRIAEYYEVSGDHQVELLLDRWVQWVLGSVHLNDRGGFELPSTLQWSGTPHSWVPGQPQANDQLHAQVTKYNQDIGIAGALIRALLHYARGSQHARGSSAPALADTAGTMARELAERLWNYRDSRGLSSEETHEDYTSFNESALVPHAYHGAMPSGAVIDGGSTFISLRPQFLSDPDFPKVQSYLHGGKAPVFRFHRFWAEVDAALAFAALDP